MNIGLHERALNVARRFRQCESQLIEILQELDRTKIYKDFDCSSLFMYATKFLDLDESVAYIYISVARKSLEVPRLQQAVLRGRLSVAKANRIVSTLTNLNADHLVSFAETHSTAAINREVAGLRQAEGLPAKPHKLLVSVEILEKIKRVQSLMDVDLEKALGQVLDEYLERHDPVKKAERAPRNELCTYTVGGRQPFTADQKHRVFARDRGQCTHRDHNGNRCTNDRYIHIHHVRPVSQGGTNDPENLTTLCAYHHRRIHTLRSPGARYA